MPRRIGGRWALIHRPMTALGAHMWISYSPDLRHWGSHKIILEARRGGWWDANKIGLCSPPIETAKGWLMIYHGVRQTASGSIYRLGLALFDLEKPDDLPCSAEIPGSSGQRRAYERNGDVNDVVFPCGQTIGAGWRHDQSVLRCGRFLHCLWPQEASAVFFPGWNRMGVRQRDVHFSAHGGWLGRGWAT